MSKTKKVLTTEERVKQYFGFRELGKRAYGRADEMLELLVVTGALKPNKPLPMPDGTKVVLVDLYPKKTMKVYRAHGVAHYELQVVKPPANQAKKKTKK